MAPEKGGKVAGDIGSVAAGDADDAYVLIKKKKTEEEKQKDEQGKVDAEKRQEDFRAQPVNTEHD